MVQTKRLDFYALYKVTEVQSLEWRHNDFGSRRFTSRNGQTKKKKLTDLVFSNSGRWMGVGRAVGEVSPMRFVE